MKISKGHKNKIIEEMNYIVARMKAEKDPKTRLYYFSAVHATIMRIFNLEFVPDLVFAHFVASATYSQLNNRINNPDAVVQLPPEILDKLISATEELLNAFKEDKSLYDALMRLTLIGYVTSGNGYYLYKKGLLKI